MASPRKPLSCPWVGQKLFRSYRYIHSFTTHQHVQRKLKYVKGKNTSHTSHSLHSHELFTPRVLYCTVRKESRLQTMFSRNVDCRASTSSWCTNQKWQVAKLAHVPREHARPRHGTGTRTRECGFFRILDNITFARRAYPKCLSYMKPARLARKSIVLCCGWFVGPSLRAH